MKLFLEFGNAVSSGLKMRRAIGEQFCSVWDKQANKSWTEEGAGENITLK